MPRFHAVVLGAGGVGKSALTLRFMRDQFIDIYDPTIEETFKREFELDGRMIALDLLDTAGIEQFAAINEFYLKDADGFVLVYSLTNNQSLLDLETIRKQVLLTKDEPDIPMIVVGTKSDLVEERNVKSWKISEFRRSWRIPFFETSAKRNIGVNEAIYDLVRQMMHQRTSRKAARRYRDDRDDREEKRKEHGRKTNCVVM